MKKVIPAIILVASFAFAVVGCQEDTGADMNSKAITSPTGVGTNSKKKNAGGAQPGTATMTQGISDAEANARIGSAGK
jgi:hypothetical protein